VGSNPTPSASPWQSSGGPDYGMTRLPEKREKNIRILDLPEAFLALHIVRPPEQYRYYLLFPTVHRLLAGLFTVVNQNSQF
jgi:hypothetical protein